jgi:hypothetical protein
MTNWKVGGKAVVSLDSDICQTIKENSSSLAQKRQLVRRPLLTGV